MFKNEDIKDVYTEDTRGRKYHNNIVTKPKERTEEPESETVTMNLYKPMVWSEFKLLTDSLKRLYIEHLRDTYKATQIEIRAMLQCGAATLHRCLSALDLIGTFPKSNAYKTKKQIKAWKDFLNNTTNETVQSESKPEPVITPTTEPKSQTKIQNFSFTQSGPFNAKEFIERITAFIKDGDKYNISISASAEKVIFEPFPNLKGECGAPHEN